MTPILQMKQLSLGEARPPCNGWAKWALNPDTSHCLDHDTELQQPANLRPVSQLRCTDIFCLAHVALQKTCTGSPCLKIGNCTLKHRVCSILLLLKKKHTHTQNKIGNTGPAFPPGRDRQELAAQAQLSPAPQAAVLPIAFLPPKPSAIVMAHCVHSVFSLLSCFPCVAPKHI